MCHRRQRDICALYGYKHTLRIRNNYCFSTASMLDEGAAMLSFTYTVLLFVKLALRRENI
jgi:hypothetical protein